jgi:hypothetical protein
MNDERAPVGAGQGDGSAVIPAPAGGRAAKQAKQPKRRKDRRPALLKRWPKIFWRRSVDDPWPDDWPVVSQEQLRDYPALRPDLEVWINDLEPRFRRLDHRAQMLQNQFWRQNLVLILGGLVATTLGAVQAAVGGGVVGIAVAQAVLTGLLAGLTVLIRSRRAQRGYLTARLTAERIKSEFFLFLAGVGDYAAGDGAAGSRAVRLRQRIDDIESAGDFA